MESRVAVVSFWIILLVSETLLCFGAPFQPDPFQGMDEDGAEGDHLFQIEMLGKLGISDPYTPPSIKKEDLVIPDHIQAKYNSLLRHQRVRRETITQSIRENPGIRGSVMLATQTRHAYTFDLTSIPAGSEVMMAELRIYKELPNQSIHKANTTHHHQVRGALVSIHQVTPNVPQEEGSISDSVEQSATRSPNSTVKVDERLIDVETFGWKNFDVTDTVIQWVADPSTNMGVELHVTPERSGSYARRVAGRVRFSPEEEPEDAEKGVPVLIVYTVKYAPVDDPVDCAADGSDSDRCCRIPKYVDFRRTSWANRWIIEPAGFESYDCTGPCHRTQHRHRTLREVFGLRPGTYQTCGVARFSSLPMMYLIERDGVSELEVQEIPNMIVEGCECTA
ncbi:left-right determination factor 1-like [Patiria miniata]|uniref:TGF-beta family profile domain-containing protein n=1 Tax=Patiria miniata TaxID=46514 RepID=A0A914BS71_PATMI|nr:left-right determination factor 1-like [Patiria miniata]